MTAVNDHEEGPPAALGDPWRPPRLRLDPPATGLRARSLLPDVWVADGVLTDDDCQRLRAALAASGRELPVSVQGRADLPDDRVGSVRATAWAPWLGRIFWEKIEKIVPTERRMSDTTATAWHHPTEHRTWRPVGVNPVLRFMRYEAGGQHFGHYDRSFDQGDGRRTLMSVVFYLTDVAEGQGGRTRFLEDGQGHLHVARRCHDDWPREARPDEVLCGVRPRRGSVLFFDHCLCHDIERFTGPASRVIIRGDIVFVPVETPG